jgi:alanyl-tRNA synthetase
METRKLYYEDPHLAKFCAMVLSCEKAEAGYFITLDQTAFYPEGGGQACDLGTLGTAQVLDVQERGEAILHLCSEPLDPGSTVEGCIDWPRRFDQMQQHTGEHIVSGIVFEKYGFHNSGFHMGNDGMEVDFDGVIPQEDIPWIEEKANEYVWKNLPVNCFIPSPQELATITYRTKRELPWPVRIVQIPGVDSCACCGIHTAFTGEVGLIKISSCSKLRGGVRLVMRCGKRAMAHIGTVYEQNRLVSQAFSAQMEKTGEAAQKMLEALAAEKNRAGQLQKQVFTAIAKDYAGQENVLYFAENLDGNQLRELADAIAGVITGYAALFSGSGERYNYCLASRDGDLRQLNKEMTLALSGRGGGKPNFQQGSLTCTKQQIEAFFSR